MSKAFYTVQQFMLRHLEESTNSLCCICYLDIVYYVLEMIEWPFLFSAFQFITATFDDFVSCLRLQQEQVSWGSKSIGKREFGKPSRKRALVNKWEINDAKKKEYVCQKITDIFGHRLRQFSALLLRNLPIYFFSSKQAKKVTGRVRLFTGDKIVKIGP